MPRKKKMQGGATVVSSDLLKFNLANGQTINTSPGSLVYMRGDVQKGEANVGSIGKAFARSFGNEDFFLTRYVGGPNGGSIALSLSFPGDIIQINLKPNEAYRISKGCFLACTPNISISATTQLKGIIGIGQDEGVIMPLVRCEGDQEGFVWIGGYGSFEKHELQNSERLIVDNGIFLACSNDLQYNLVQLGKSLWSSLAGGEGFGMEFRGPGIVYTQSKNFNEFISLISNADAHTTLAGSVADTMKKNTGQAIGNALTDWMTSESEGGSKGRKKKSPASTKKKGPTKSSKH